MISRIIGQSKEGTEGAGADYTTKTTTSSTSILLDESFNPGIELTSAQLNEQLTDRLNYNSQTFKEANFERAYDTVAELRTIISQLGSMATFSGTGAAQYFGLTMRIVGLSFNPSKKTVQIQLAPKAARYAKLPKDVRGLKPKSETKHSKPKPPNYGDYTNPIVPQPKPGSNGSDIPGGNHGSGINPPTPETPPPFTVPNDDYTDTDSVISSSEVRLFKSPSMLLSESQEEESQKYKYWNKTITPMRARFNHNTGEYIGLNLPYQTRYHIYQHPPLAGYVGEKFVDLEIYSYNLNDLFAPHAGSAYQESTVESINSSNPIIADSDKKLIGTIPLSEYDDIELSVLDFIDQIPEVPNAGTRNDGAVRGVYDYIFFCSEDFQTLYVQIVYNISSWNRVGSYNNYSTHSWSYTATKTLKGTRNVNGVVDSWEDLGPTFVASDFSGSYVYLSPSIYEINGEFVSFGGYALPIIEQGVEIENQGSTAGNREYVPKLPYYYMNSYNNSVIKVNLDDFYIDRFGVNMNFPVYYGEKATTIEEFNIPYAVKVDYKRKKIIIGFSRGPKNLSVFYETDFDWNFTKIMETQKEVSNISLDSRSNNNRYSTYQPVEDIFKFSLNTPVFYKGNYILINAESDNQLNTMTSRGLKYIRGKTGFDDKVSGKLNLPDTNSRFTGKVKDNLLFSNYSFNGNTIGAFYSYHNYAWGEYGSTRDHTVWSSGFDSILYNGKMYIISDYLYGEVGSASPYPAGLINGNKEKTFYWIGEFNLDDTKL